MKIKFFEGRPFEVEAKIETWQKSKPNMEIVDLKLVAFEIGVMDSPCSYITVAILFKGENNNES